MENLRTGQDRRAKHPINYGEQFKARLKTGKILPLIGIYDLFSARIAMKEFEGVFCSGFGYSASAYGMQDIGYVSWTDICDFASKVRHAVGNQYMLVDVDDGFGDKVIAATTIRNVEERGASAVMFEDQKRPRKCGHFAGKEILPIPDYIEKLELVLSTRRSTCVIARTDATDPEEGIERAYQYAQAGADAVMVEAVKDLKTLEKLRKRVSVPIMVNQLYGGKSPNWSLEQMESSGANIVIYSTPCLFAAQDAIQKYLQELKRNGGVLPSTGTATMDEAKALLMESPDIV